MFGKQHMMLKFFLTTILVIGGLAWGILGMTGWNPISRFANLLGLPILTRTIYTLVGLSAIMYLLKFYNKDSFLPFLGKSLLPANLLNVGQPAGNYDRELSIPLPNGSDANLLAFWAAESDPKVKSPSAEEAYGDFTNSGVVPVVNGQATIKFKNPSDYHVAQGTKHLKSHVHYRWIGKKMMGEVNTIFL